MKAMQQLMINGAWQPGEATRFTKHDPVSGASLWRGAAASDAQVSAAIEAARRAFPGWARLTFAERLGVVERFREALEGQREVLAQAIAGETGKPLWEARTEVGDRKSTRLNSSHVAISYAVFCLKKKKSITEMW